MRVGAVERAAPAASLERVQVNYGLELVRSNVDLAKLAVAAISTVNGRAPTNAAGVLHPERPELINGEMTLNGNTCCFRRCDDELRKIATLRLPFEFSCSCGSRWRIRSNVERRS